jgi:DNA transformation protein and related proteins
MSADAGLINWVVEALAPMGSVTKRAMMGGATLYLDGTVFAIVDDDALWFKSDKVSDAIWDAEGCVRFTFDMGGKMGSMNYRRAPDDVYDDADTMQLWAGVAVEAGRRAPARKKRT